MADGTFFGGPADVNAANSTQSQVGEVVVTDDLSLLMAALPPRVRMSIEDRGTRSTA